MNGDAALITPSSIIEAATALEPVALRTPLLRTHWLDELGLGAEIRLKDEIAFDSSAVSRLLANR